MSIKCGWASIDERGKISGGRAGDQTGREVKTGNWYYFGQTQVIRWKSRSDAKKYAKIIEAFCKNPHIGYDQLQRTTLYTYLQKRNWETSGVLENVETDCSETVVCGVNVTMGRKLLSSALYTGNLATGLMATGLFSKYTGSKYCKSDAYLMTGDIIIKPNGHVITALENGSKAGQKSPVQGAQAVAQPVLRKGSTGSQVKKLQANLNHCAVKVNGKYLELDGSFGVLTRSAVKKFQSSHHLDPDGVYGPKTYKKMLAHYK